MAGTAVLGVLSAFFENVKCQNASKQRVTVFLGGGEGSLPSLKIPNTCPHRDVCDWYECVQLPCCTANFDAWWVLAWDGYRRSQLWTAGLPSLPNLAVNNMAECEFQPARLALKVASLSIRNRPTVSRITRDIVVV